MTDAWQQHCEPNSFRNSIAGAELAGGSQLSHAEECHFTALHLVLYCMVAHPELSSNPDLLYE